MIRRRATSYASRVSTPSFMDSGYSKVKNTVRIETARLFAQHITRRNAQILCMPYYEALCVKAINAVLPDATFVGCEQVHHISEMFAEAAPGKKIEVRKMRIGDYVKQDIDSKRFDAAFLDYMGRFSDARLDEIIAFIKTKMIEKYIIAITLQGDMDTIQQLSKGLTENFGTIQNVFSMEYETKTQMCHSIFVGEL